ncbi:hypothetical protein PS898_02987 [Pseudomonas fluorescens]|nr:hypothetical protein PS898_02987 [Pseudomonas fluorescens]
MRSPDSRGLIQKIIEVFTQRITSKKTIGNSDLLVKLSGLALNEGISYIQFADYCCRGW